MKTALIAALFTGLFVSTALATNSEGERAPQGGQLTVEQKKSAILQHIEERITAINAEKACVKSAKSHEELKYCREKYRPQPKDNRGNRNQQPQS
ncbi:MAG: hypothetical protein HXX17_03275 [Geobacteraceae bacterium]|nr:hypothetical protein [Geobacteraceae bacterium]